MQITPKNRRRLVVGAALFLVTVPSFAIFGVGDIVFDPSNWAQAVQEVTMATQTYNTVSNNLRYFSAKSIWNTAKSQFTLVNVENKLGETAGLQNTLNGNSPGMAGTAWQMMTIANRATSSGYLSGEVAGMSQHLSAMAMVEATDAVSPYCLNAVGQYRANIQANAQAETTLRQQQLDGGPNTNTEIQQLNMLNASEVQKLNEMESEGPLHACMAAQAAIQQMNERNAAVQQLNDAAFVQSQQAANPTYAGNESGTWDTYLP